MVKVFSADFSANFGFFGNPETNNGVRYSYSYIHKPAILGMAGAIIGLSDIENMLSQKGVGLTPKYIEVFRGISVAIEPLNHYRGNFRTTFIDYNNATGHASNIEGNGATLQIREKVLKDPSFRIYFCLNIESKDEYKKFYEYLKNNEAHFLPYFGRSNYRTQWNNFTEYEYEKVENSPQFNYKISSIFKKGNAELKLSSFDYTNGEDSFVCNEILPDMWIRIEGKPTSFKQYQLKQFVFTNVPISGLIEKLYLIKTNQEERYVQFH